MPTQSIIVYRNPLEQQMWEGLMSGNFFPIIVGVFVFFIVLLSLHRFVIDRTRGLRYKIWPTNVALAISAAAGVAVVMYMV